MLLVKALANLITDVLHGVTIICVVASMTAFGMTRDLNFLIPIATGLFAIYWRYVAAKASHGQ